MGAMQGALAHAFDSLVGNQLDEHPVSTALARRRHRHEVALELLDLHAPTLAGNGPPPNSRGVVPYVWVDGCDRGDQDQPRREQERRGSCSNFGKQ